MDTARTATKNYNLCILGFGNVGRGLAHLLIARASELQEQFAATWKVTGVATRRLGWLSDPAGLDLAAVLNGTAGAGIPFGASNVREWLAASQADVLVELSSLNAETGQPGIKHIETALRSRIHAVTANKGTIVHGYHHLRQLAHEHNVRFLFEATFMGGAPIFSLFRDTLPLLRLRRFHGILNSTTTVILEAMEGGGSFADGVKQAQDLGIAETDPSADVDGWDAAVKVAGLATVLMDAPLQFHDIGRQGIGHLDGATVRAARAAGTPYRLVSRAEIHDGRIRASVRPERVSTSDPMSMVTGTTVQVHFETDILPGLTISAHNGDAVTTAYDVLADLITIVKDDTRR